jgi:hypothetical protein
MFSFRLTARLFIAVCAAWTASTVTAGSALAASCDYTNLSSVFAQWQDDAGYTPFQGSSFESGASGWSWANGAKIVSGDSNPLLGAGGSHSVQVPGGGAARSPWLCVNSSTPSMRFFVRRTSGTGSLTVKFLLSSGGKQATTVTTISDSTATWDPSPVVVFPEVLTASTTGVNVQFHFVADPGSTFRIDDIELDPYLRR